MLSPYYRFLTLPEIFFDKDQISFDLSKSIDQNKNNHWNQLNYIFNDKIFSFFSSLDCTLINSELFYTPPFGRLPWHIDMNPPEDFVKINYVWGSENHIMCYGETKDTNKIFVTSKTAVNTQYISLDDNEVLNVTAVKINQPVIINAGRPHKIVNFDSTGRWCLSLIITKNDRRILFKDAIEIFSEYVVN